MTTMSRMLVKLLLCVTVLASGVAFAGDYTRVTIVAGSHADGVEQRVAALLAKRIAEKGQVSVRSTTAMPSATQDTGVLTIVLGTAAHHPVLRKLAHAQRVKLPNATDPGSEGFMLKTVAAKNGPCLLAAGVGDRGVLYAVGEILRQTVDRGDHITFPDNLNIWTAPAFRYRGTQVSQGDTMRELTGVRKWTPEEFHRAVLDYALAGANILSVGHIDPTNKAQVDFAKSYGLMTMVKLSPNAGSGPPAWQATEAIGRPGYLCLSVPAARASILKTWNQRCQKGPAFDFYLMVAGDGGGCECEKCAPYGKTYIHMCADIAAIIHKYNPKAKIFATNQKLNNAGDQAIFDYLNKKPRKWLTAFCYGPGSNAMSWQPGRRQDHRMDLFSYPAFGPLDRYIREIVHELPPQQSLVFYTGLTHWVYSEYGLVDYAPHPDLNGDLPPHWGHWVYEQHPAPAFDMVYNRRTFFARPRAYYRAFQATMRYGEGDVTYSEGIHDHFNQWMWQRLLWAPHTSLNDVVNEYARTWFGPDAASRMAKAIFQFEQNLCTPVANNKGIDRFYDLVSEAGRRMPDWIMKNNWLWRQYMQRAALDKYIQLEVRGEMALDKRVTDRLGRALHDGDLGAGLADAKTYLAGNLETATMKRYKTQAGHLGDESAALYGVRNVGYFNLDQDFVGLGWLKQEVKAAAAASGDKQRAIINQIVNYDDPGEGGFYDDAGDPARSPHLTYGWPYDDGSVSAANRPSQRTMAFTSNESRGVTFEYHNLDKKAHYRVRFTFVRPVFAARYAGRQTQHCQSIYADGTLLAKNVELPKYKAKFFEYNIPQRLTADGNLTISLKKAAGVGEGPKPEVEVWRNTGGWGTLVSEVWLMKVH